MHAIPKLPTPVNEPVLSYAPGTPERAELKQALKDLAARPLEIPLVIGGKEVRTGRTADVVMPPWMVPTLHEGEPSKEWRRC